MGYGKQFSQYHMPEWSAFYLDYCGLKRSLSTFFSLSRGTTTIEEPVRPMLITDNSLSLEPLLSQEARHDTWIDFLETELAKVSSFFKTRRDDLEKEISNIITHLQSQRSSAMMWSNSTDLKQQVPSLWRAVQQTHTGIWSLEVYCEVNYHACLHLSEILKTKRKMPQLAETVIQLAKGAGLDSSIELHAYRRRLYKVIADNITGDIAKARDLVASGSRVYDASEVFHIAFCLGVSLVLVVWSLQLLMHLDHSVIVSSVPVFRMTFCLLLCMWICCFAIYIFEKFNISWRIVLDTKTQFSVSYMRLMRATSTLTAGWALMFMIHSYYLSFIYQDEHRDFVSITTWIIFMAMTFLPGYPEIRNGILLTLFHIFITPFGRLEFKHFFLADVLTSMAKPLTDLARGWCYLASDSWLVNQPPVCPHQNFWFCVITILPLYFRLIQCFVKYRITRDAFPHLFNALKYVLSISVVIALYVPVFVNPAANMSLWLSLSVVTTLYTIYWDTVIDFGLIRCSRGFKTRGAGVFPKWFYVVALLANALLRCVWILTLFPMDFLGHDMMEVELVLLAVAVFELLRRGLWTVLRIENEKYNNLEKFRKVDFIPRVPTVVRD